MGTYVDEAAIGGEIAASISASISERVAAVRSIKARIEEIRDESGIIQLEQNNEVVRSELLDLTKQYHELTGTNWQDDLGFAQYKKPGESHRYDRVSVDEALAGMMSLQQEMMDDLGMVELADPQAQKLVHRLAMRLEAMDRELKNLAAARHTNIIKETVAVK